MEYTRKIDITDPAGAKEEEQSLNCIVCGALHPRPFSTIDNVCYIRCSICHATFLNPEHRLPIEEEHRRYRLHRNYPFDPNYRRFLSKLAEPLLQRLAEQSKGLDYGCGPGPALAFMFQEAGHHMRLFDPLFFPDPEPLEHLYDFITCTETIEHFHRPAREFARFDRMLRPGGWLGLMTCFQTRDDRFTHWHYRRDPTHVVFYRATTMSYIARQFGWACEIPIKDVALMRKP